MPTNFIQWNPNATNQETDAQYSADTQRSAGAANPAIFASATANKLFYQLSTFITAFATALSNKGYSVTDTSLVNLAGVLANVMTASDMTPYAPLASPTLSGTPLAPTPATADSTTKIATTAFVKNQAYQANLGFTPVQQSGGAGQLTNKLYVGWDGTQAKIQVDSTDFGAFALKGDFPSASNSGITNYAKLSNGVIFQWGTGGVGNGTTLTLPTTFPAGIYQVAAVNIGGGAGVPTAKMVCPQAVNGSSFKVWVYDQTGTISSTNISWIAIGF